MTQAQSIEDTFMDLLTSKVVESVHLILIAFRRIAHGWVVSAREWLALSFRADLRDFLVRYSSPFPTTERAE